MAAARSAPEKETHRIFRKWGLPLERNSRTEYLLGDLLKLLYYYGFQLESKRKSGSHFNVVYHPDLHGHSLAYTGRVTIPVIHKKREMVKKHEVKKFIPLITYLRQIGDYNRDEETS